MFVDAADPTTGVLAGSGVVLGLVEGGGCLSTPEPVT